MTWDCARLEQRLSEYLEGRLPTAELPQADAHARACPRCGEHFLARQATTWLHGLEGLESPPGLETRILALTVAPPPRENFWQALLAFGRTLRQPRVAMGVAAAVFSLALVLNAMDVSVRDLELADLNPANLYRGVKRQAHLTYAKGSRFVDDLWLVYEIRSGLDELEQQEPPPSEPSQPEQKPEEHQPENGAARTQWLLAFHHLAVPGDS